METLDAPQFLLQTRLLIVENDLRMSAHLQKILEHRVGEILLARDGGEGLRLWEMHAPDIVLTNIDLPVFDGFALVERIRAVDGDAAVVVMSSSSSLAMLHRIIDAGIDGYVIQPIDEMLLFGVLFRCMRDRQRVLDLKMASMVFEVANEGIMVTDENARILAVNPAFSEITGYRAHEVIGQRTRMLQSGVHGPDFYRAMWQTLLTHGRWAGEITNRRKDGSHYSQWLSIAAVNQDSGGAQRYVGLVSDISERKQEEERIRRLAHFDALTGLPNRALFEDRLQRAIVRARRYRQTLAVLYVDLDHFKAVNDTWGHAAGDEMLCVVSNRMLEVLRQSDTISRRGGDEFVILVDLQDHPEGIGNVCAKLVNEVSRPVPYGLFELCVGASIGVALYPNDAEQPDELLAAADVALYEAKASGRSRFNFFRPEMQHSACSRLELERELREGLDDWRYTLHYLPEYSLATGKIEQIEALLRFQHPEFGLMEAGRFLEIAEDIGIMPELGRKALEQATRELAEIEGNIGLVVDLSARQLSAPDAVARLLDTLRSAGMPQERITFECTEAMLTGNEQAVQTLYRLAESGCKFTLDDFGAGFCSFSLLSQLPMSSIKIDRSFTQQIVDNLQMRELVGALIAFAHRLKLRAVAEGVESAEQLALLREMGCDAAQGYYFGHPVTLGEWFARQSGGLVERCAGAN